MLRGVVFAVLLPSSVSSSVVAADIYRREPVSYKDTPVYAAPHLWQGFYIGANLGYGWSENDSGTLDVLATLHSIYPLADQATSPQAIRA